jgi:type VI secretion system secreted protein Hcp
VTVAVAGFRQIGTLKGESKDKVHAGKIDVLAWSWGCSNSGTTHGAGLGAGKASVQDLSFTRYIDKCRPGLRLACCQGTHQDTATLIVRKAGGKPLEYLTATLSEVMVSGVSTGGSGAQDQLTETVILNFARVEVDSVEQKADGTESDKPTRTYDVAQNASE